MSTEDRMRIKALFEAALDIDADRRAAFLAEACGSDLALRRRLDVLLRRHDEAGDFLESPPTGADLLASAPGGPPGPSREGSRVGPYELRERIGSGGMGDVYLAERADAAFEKRVALKVIRPGLDTEDVIRRFVRERQALASLDHPNIARLLDGGTTGDGVPYLVLEHVAGEPITAYCDRHRLPIAGRLELFREVCTAVQFAHRNLVIHRDLKPGNILVTPDGTPKLLDFGIAKVLDPETKSADTETLTAQRFFTPDYASPEQIRGRPLTTASDVYSLGVILYELLASRRPYRLTRRSPTEVERIVCNEMPPAPSAALARPQSPESAGGVISDCEGLRRRLRGDLDTIVLMALRKEPERRYSSVEQLSEDVRRHLDGFPVIARKDTVRYRTAKFVRRNRVAVAAAAIIVALLVAGIIGSVYSARRITRAWDRARAEAQEGERARTWFTSFLSSAESVEIDGRRVTLEEILDRRAESLAAAIQDPAARARMFETIAEVYGSLALSGRAAHWLERAIELHRGPVESDDSTIARVLRRQADFLAETKRPSDALAPAREVVSVFEREGDEAMLASGLHTLGVATWRSGEIQDAVPLMERALELHLRVHGEDHPYTIETMRQRAHFAHHLGDYAVAESYSRRALVAARRLYRDDHTKILATLNSLGGVLHSQDRLAEAESFMRQSVDGFERVFGSEHPWVLGGKANLSLLLKDMERYDEAVALAREAVDGRIRFFGEDHSRTGFAWRDYAKVLCDRGDLAAAESAGERALAIHRLHFGDSHHYTVEPLVQLARIRIGLGKHAEAIPLLEAALETSRREYAADYWKTAQAEGLLGAALTGLGRYEEAEPLVIDSIPRVEADRGPHEPRTVRAIERAVELYRVWGEPRELAEWEARLDAARAGRRRR